MELDEEKGDTYVGTKNQEGEENGKKKSWLMN